MAGQQPLPTLRHQTAVVSSAPPAHSHAHTHASPKHVTTSRGMTRPAEQQQYMIISSPKKAKYSIGKYLKVVCPFCFVTVSPKFECWSHSLNVSPTVLMLVPSFQICPKFSTLSQVFKLVLHFSC